MATKKTKRPARRKLRPGIDYEESSGNIFLDIGFPLPKAAVLLLRCQLAEGIRRWIERDELTQARAARMLGISQPRISDIVRNKLENYSLDYLVGLCAKADITVSVKVKPKPRTRPKAEATTKTTKKTSPTAARLRSKAAPRRSAAAASAKSKRR